ncbi:MAG: hypothetical protein HZB38_08925 [Planctomycetes bacterium]|nr:hypothetical protein [Planctomycetota bacterium]
MVDTKIAESTGSIAAFDFDTGARALLAADAAVRSASVNIATLDSLLEKVSAARRLLRASEADYLDKIRSGWLVFEGKLISGAERDSILAERKRREEESRRAMLEAERKAAEELEKQQQEEQAKHVRAFAFFLVVAVGDCDYGRKAEQAGKLALPYVIDQALREAGFRPEHVSVCISGDLPTNLGLHRYYLIPGAGSTIKVRPFDPTKFKAQEVELDQLPNNINVRVCVDFGELMNDAWKGKADRAKEADRRAIATAIKLYAEEIVPDMGYTWSVEVDSVVWCFCN